MTTKLQSLTELWQEFNLTGTQSLLDELATEITTRYKYMFAYIFPENYEYKIFVKISHSILLSGKMRAMRAGSS